MSKRESCEENDEQLCIYYTQGWTIISGDRKTEITENVWTTQNLMLTLKLRGTLSCTVW